MSSMTIYEWIGSVAAISGLVLGCASQQPRPEHSAAVTETPPEVESVSAPECVNDKDQPVECLSDGDCCQGFVCGKDPELSQRVSFCIYGG